MPHRGNLGYADWQELKERVGDALIEGAKVGYKAGSAPGAVLGGLARGMIEARRISRETNEYLHPTDAKRRAYYDKKRAKRS